MIRLNQVGWDKYGGNSKGCLELQYPRGAWWVVEDTMDRIVARKTPAETGRGGGLFRALTVLKRCCANYVVGSPLRLGGGLHDECPVAFQPLKPAI